MNPENAKNLIDQPENTVYHDGTVNEWLMQQARDIATQIGIFDDTFTKDPEIETDDSNKLHQRYEIYEGEHGAEVFILRQYTNGTLIDARVIGFDSDDTCIRSVITHHKLHYFSVLEEQKVFYPPNSHT